MLEKKRILIIEDEKTFAELVKMNLELTGVYDVNIALDGNSGLDRVKKERPDLVILDLSLPGMPGEEICREIRRDKEISKMPVIMLTGKSRDAERIVGRVIGADAYLTKPADIREVLDAIRKNI
ncbi:MAG: response regulator [Candidatus Omnitrophica bacterium]|nr:response regulator [Candidatus Omnitrophota bacterium]